MRRFVLGLFTAIGIAVVLGSAVVGALVWHLAAGGPTLPDTMVLTPICAAASPREAAPNRSLS